MAKRAWTKEQSAAFNTRDRTLLVSAAAGSGKTATLTERIIRSILDESNPGDISRMLIVTFTNAAVNELKERISGAIRAAAMENPDNARLEEQLLCIKDAKICTINSFCNNILRSAAERVRLTPGYRIAEPGEAGIIADSILLGMINAAYEGELPEICSPEEFSIFADGLTNVKNEAQLSEIFTLLYDKLTCEENGVENFGKLVELYNPENYEKAEKTHFFKYITASFREAITDSLGMLEKSVRSLTDEGAGEKTLDVFCSDIEIINNTLMLSSYSDLHNYTSGISFKSMVNSKCPSYPEAKNARDIFVKIYKDYSDKYFSVSEENIEILYTKLYKNTGIMAKFLKKYDELFLEEKRRRGIVEFRDAERYACLALWDGDSPSDIALELSQRYDYIYVDEYQDVNALQGRVFEAISRDNNCFMVGDIKQSIYGFRSAKPDFFAAKKASYPPLGAEGDYPRASIFMSDNFRCDKNIIDFTNSIFDKLFGKLGGSIGYVEADRLNFAKVYNTEAKECDVCHIPEIHLVECKKSSVPDADMSASDFSEDVEEEEINSIRRCADEVALQISMLIGKEKKANGEYIKPGDIAILMRSVKSSEEIYAEAIAKHGFDCEICGNTNFFYNEEVLLALSLLNTIDNPLRDVHLTAVLTSPLFGFSFDELLLIKKKNKCDSLYEALCQYTDKNPGYEKGKYFLSVLSKYRIMAEGAGVDELISLLYRETGLLTLAEGSGGKENLMLLYSYARKYEASSFHGLYSFISYINNIIKNEGTIDTGDDRESSSDNKIKIITSHRSKGLEFPVCIISEAQKRIHISERGAAARIKLASDFGFSMGIRDSSGLAMLENPISSIISHYNKEKEYEEALRVLYVALTRARERLYIFGTVGNIEKALESVELKRDNFTEYTAKNLTSMLDMILVCHSCGRVIEHPLSNVSYNTEDDTDNLHSGEAEQEEKQGNSETPHTLEINEGVRDELLARFNYIYPNSHLCDIPEKLSVSRLSPVIFDESGKPEPLPSEILDLDMYFDGAAAEEYEQRPTVPAFIRGNDWEESAKRGIATHTFMQFCDFENLEKCGAEGELQRLIKSEFISKEDSTRVRISEIQGFIKSPLFVEMKNAKQLYRELRFNIKLPAEGFTKSEQRKAQLRGTEILVQGVIDCIIEDSEGGLHLIDYKTDRLTKEERSNTVLAAARLTAAHSLQLSYYSAAIEKIFGKAPEKIGIYSTHLMAEIPIKL